MNTELLKKKILQLAMQGKLVEQDESDGTADELIDQILEEKKKLMAEGKIKKEKLSRIYKNPTDNHYYEKFEDGKEKPVKTSLVLPNGWNYIKMNDVVFYEQPSKYIVESTEYDDKYTTPVLTPGKSFILGYTKETKGVFTNIPTIIFDDFTTESKYVDFVFKVKSSAMKILNCSNLINIKFIYYLLQVINIDTTTHKRHWLSNYEYMLIPIPCKKIQDKIVNRIESLFDKVNEIDNHYNRIDRLKSVLKSKIIDLAIKGELTKQLSTDEPSSKLIENTIEEKHKLMAEGKIKKENLSIIYKDTDNQFYEKFDDKVINITDEIQYNIPSSWSYARLGSIIDIARGGSPRPIKDFLTNDNNGINWIKIGDTRKGDKYINSAKEKIRPEGKKKSRYVKKGDFLLTNSMSFGRPYILNIDGCIHDGWLVLGNLSCIFNEDFLFYLLSSKYIFNQFSNKASGSAVDNLNIDKVKDTIVFIPPKDEQKRIVFQIEQLLTILK